MAGDLNNRAEEITDVTQDSNTEIALDDLEANAGINGGTHRSLLT